MLAIINNQTEGKRQKLHSSFLRKNGHIIIITLVRHSVFSLSFSLYLFFFLSLSKHVIFYSKTENSGRGGLWVSRMIITCHYLTKFFNLEGLILSYVSLSLSPFELQW